MATELNRVDFCNTFKIAKKTSLASPLDAVDPLGIASLGCNPLLSSRAAANNAILSRVNQNNGAYVSELLASTNDNHVNGGQPNYSAYIAGLSGANPIGGSAVSPFPSSLASYTFDYDVAGFVFREETNPVVAPPKFSEDPFGFGLFTQPTPWLLLGGGQAFDWSNLGTRAPYHSYEQVFRMAYCPTDSMTAVYDPSVPEFRTTDLGSATLFAMSAISGGHLYGVNLYLWEVRPALTAFASQTVAPELLDPHHFDVGENTPPGFTRTYGLVDFGQLTMPPYGGSTSATYNLTPTRPWMVGYATANIDSITFNGVGGAGFGGSISNIHLGSGGTVVSFPQSFQWNLGYATQSFDFSVVIGGVTVTRSAILIGDGVTPKVFEALIVGTIT